MFRERFEKPFVPKTDEPSQEELDVAHNVFQDADQTTYSPLPLTGEINHTMDVDMDYRGKPYTVEVHETGSYVEILTHPRVQKFVGLLAKGIIPIADVVSHTERPHPHYSKMMVKENIQQETTEDQLQAYFKFMSLVFGDHDHRHFNGKQHNFTHQDGKALLYDFGNYNLNADLLSMDSGRRDTYTKDTVEYLKSLLAQFEERIQGDEGKIFLHSALEHARIQPAEVLDSVNPRTVEDLQEVLLSRTRRAELIAENARRELLEVQEVK